MCHNTGLGLEDKISLLLDIRCFLYLPDSPFTEEDGAKTSGGPNQSIVKLTKSRHGEPAETVLSVRKLYTNREQSLCVEDVFK